MQGYSKYNNILNNCINHYLGINTEQGGVVTHLKFWNWSKVQLCSCKSTTI